MTTDQQVAMFCVTAFAYGSAARLVGLFLVGLLARGRAESAVAFRAHWRWMGIAAGAFVVRALLLERWGG